MMTVKDVCNLSGVSVRTLHYYDTIGLLIPSDITEAGYRLYDEASLIRLQNILLFRELQFPLKEIKVILDSPSFNCSEALDSQIKLLRLKQIHIDRLINLALEIKMQGASAMDFKAFNTADIDKYADEVRQKWGNTEEYKQFKDKPASKSRTGAGDANDKLMLCFCEFGKIKGTHSPDDNEALACTEALKQTITDNFYDCSNEILSSLGNMYTGDERFKNTIDSAGGQGTAEFAAKAISAYCGCQK